MRAQHIAQCNAAVHHEQQINHKKHQSGARAEERDLLGIHRRVRDAQPSALH